MAFQSNTDNDVTVSNMFTKGADTSSRSMFCEHNALNVLNMCWRACRCCFLYCWCHLICREQKGDPVILVLKGTLDFLDSQV